MTALSQTDVVGIIGAGTMGAGIAQVAAAAGHPVRLFDAAPDAAEAGKARLAKGLAGLVSRGRMTPTEREGIVSRIEIAARPADLAHCSLIIEAIIEDIEIKRRLFAEIENVVGPQAIMASNTSSISITAIARNLSHPERFVGMHFFNPAPIMKLVEVISGVATSSAVAQDVLETALSWGKVAVAAKSTPGFIVNRVARAYYAEPLRLYEEKIADPATLDALMTEGGGFRMGPFDLMDLIGHDVNYAVSQSVFNAYYQEPRFRPSVVQQELVSSGRLGRKTGQGFFSYNEGAKKPSAATVTPVADAEPIDAWVPGAAGTVDTVAIVPTNGTLAHELASTQGCPVIVTDLLASAGPKRRMGFSTSADVPESAVMRMVATLARAGIAATRLPDWPGLVVMRTVAMLVNEGFEAVLQGVADGPSVDAAMIHGVNYPKGPIAWAHELGLSRVVSVLDNLIELTGDPRYRASFGLRRAAIDGYSGRNRSAP